MRIKRIAHVTLSMQSGGVENLILSLVRNADPGRFAFYCYCLDSGGLLLNELEELGAKNRIMHRKPGLDLQLFFKLAQCFRQDGIDVVHTHNQAAHFYGCLAGRLAGVRTILNTEHSRHYIEERKRRRLEKRFLSFFTTKMLTVSKELYQIAHEKDKIPEKKLAIVGNGIDINRFRYVSNARLDALREEIGIKDQEKVLSTIARLDPIKNHQLLLQAMHLVTKHIPEVKLLIVGDGEIREELESKTEQLGLSGNVLFLGERKDVPEILNITDALVLSSKREGLPLILLEAMAAKVPIVLTQGANKSAVIDHEVSGLVCEENAEDLKKNIMMVLANMEMQYQLAVNALNKVQDGYSIQHTLQAYQHLYTS